MKKIVKHYMAFGLMIVALALTACSDLYGTHEKYLKMAEEIYIGLADSLTANGGFNRIQLKWQLNADPRISTCEISWTDSEQPLVVAADRTEDYMSTIIDLPEGKYLFKVIVKSDSGKESLPRTVSGEVYGSVYQSRLPQKAITSMKNTADGILIAWAPEEGCVGVRLVYTTKDGNEKNTLIVNEKVTDGDVLEVTLDDALPGSEFKQFSLYKPEKDAIDSIESDESIFTFPG